MEQTSVVGKLFETIYENRPYKAVLVVLRYVTKPPEKIDHSVSVEVIYFTIFKKKVYITKIHQTFIYTIYRKYHRYIQVI